MKKNAGIASLLQTRRGQLAAAGFVVILGLIISVFLVARDEGPAPDSKDAEKDPRSKLAELPGFHEVMEGDWEERALIQRVDLEKPEICPGDDVKISVRMDDTKKISGFDTEASVQGMPSGEAVLRFAHPGERSFYVAVTDGRRGMDFRTGLVKVLPADSPACAKRPRLVLYSRALAHETYHFAVVDSPFVTADTYRWDFGDGLTQETKITAPTVEHSFGARSQDRHTSVYHVAVTALSSGREVAKARTTVVLPNTYFRTLEIGSPQLPVDYSPLLKKVQDQPLTYEAQIRFGNPDHNAVTFDKANLSIFPCKEKTTREESPDVASLLDKTTVPSGGTSAKIRFVVSEEPCRIDVSLSGDTNPPRSGSTARRGSGTIGRTTVQLSLSTRPPSDQGKQKLQELIQLEKARLILGKEDVTEEEMRQLKNKWLL